MMSDKWVFKENCVIEYRCVSVVKAFLGKTYLVLSPSIALPPALSIFTPLDTGHFRTWKSISFDFMHH